MYLYRSKWMNKACYFVSTPIEGQGGRRTAMIEAACEELVKRGVDAVVYYQMD